MIKINKAGVIEAPLIIRRRGKSRKKKDCALFDACPDDYLLGDPPIRKG